MSWERRGARLYAYESYRAPDGRVRKRYLGRGAEANAAERRRAEARAERKADAAAATALAARYAALDRLDAALDAAVEAVVTVVLNANGIYKHHGTWRKRRERRNDCR